MEMEQVRSTCFFHKKMYNYVMSLVFTTRLNLNRVVLILNFSINFTCEEDKPSGFLIK